MKTQILDFVKLLNTFEKKTRFGNKLQQSQLEKKIPLGIFLSRRCIVNKLRQNLIDGITLCHPLLVLDLGVDRNEGLEESMRLGFQQTNSSNSLVKT